MSDKTSNGASGRSDLDPFAELTRIMGFDPREPVAKASPPIAAQPAVEAESNATTSPPTPEAAAASQDDFGIDLEQELLGELADDDKSAQVELAADEPAEQTPANGSVAPTEAEAEQEAVDLREIEDDISSHVSEFLAAEEESTTAQAEPVSIADTSEAEEAQDDAIVAAEETVADSAGFDIETSLDEAFDEPAAKSATDTATKATADDWEPAPFLSGRPKFDKPEDSVASPSSMADVDMDFDSETPGAAEPAANERALEAEYNALLGNRAENPEAATPVEKPAPVRNVAEQRAASIVAGTWSMQGRAMAEPSSKPAMQAAAQEPQNDDFDLAASNLDAADQAEGPSADDFDDVADEAVAEAAPSATSKAIHEPAPEDPFAALAAMAAKYQSDSHQTAWRDTASKYEAPRPEPRVAMDAAPVQPRPSAFQPRAVQYTPAPAIETVDVHDQAVAMADDLDLPEVAFDEPQTGRYDDLDAEFNNLLHEMSTPQKREPSAPPQSYSPPRQSAYAEPRQAYREQPSPIRIEPQAAAPRYDEAPVRQAPASRYDEEDLGPLVSDSDFEEAMAAFEAEAEEDDYDSQDNTPAYAAEKRRPRRGLWIAAIVGVLALVGGIGAVAISFGGSNDAGSIAMIKADAKPIKVRPENPGGSTAPSQGGSVYDTVSRSGAPAAPTQETLVTTEEMPLDLPSPDDEVIEEVAEPTDQAAAPMGKDEERVEATAEPQPAQNDETIAVAPRKVRTMVVKSDGTLVPREEPAPEVTGSTTPIPAPEAIANDPAPEQITTGATTPDAPAAAEEVAALQPETPAAPPAGSWSVQVSSQPSEEGANKSMKDLARKYAGVIGDRGAHIVKAEVDGKGTMWRVRIPAGSRDEAIGLCGDLKAAGGSCFVTK